MNELQFIANYLPDERRRKSFFELAANIFGLRFEHWYESESSSANCIPYSFVADEKVVANVSVNLLDFIIEGEKKKALQIGTVMTHPEYRNRGLSTGLMNKVLERYENHCDFIYLFANA